MKKAKEKIFSVCRFLENSRSMNAINASIIALIPFIIVSSFITVIIQFPVPRFQQISTNGFIGLIIQILSIVNVCMLDCLSLFLSMEIGLNYAKREYHNDSTKYILPCITVSFFLLSVGVFSSNFSQKFMGKSGLFCAIFASLFGCKFYVCLSDWMNKHRKNKRKYMDYSMAGALDSILPATITVTAFALFCGILYSLTNGFTVQDLFILLINKVLGLLSDDMVILDIVYFLICQLLWFMGIHGPHTLFESSQNYFMHGFLPYSDMISPKELIINGNFNNFYINIGGSGATLSLLVLILIFSKKKHYRSMAKISIIPSLFNINELLIFGIPIVFNPIYLIPFILVPVVNVLVGYFATSSGLVPIAQNGVTWATPILISGYLCTESIRGSILQIVLFIIDCFIYFPFVKLQDEEYQVRFLNMVKELTNKLQEMEDQNDNSSLLQMEGDYGQTANLLVNDLEEAVNKNELFLLYQPQFHGDGTCIGAEALLRWNHPQAGFIYPPLIIVLAKEGGFLTKLEEFIFDESCKTLSEIQKESGDQFKISVNVTGESLKSDKFESILSNSMEKYHITPDKLWIEITEQDALASTSEIVEKLNRIKTNGHKLLIDDFGMGHTSINYLQTNLFDVVKLDGCITRTVLENSRNQEIISSIVYLSQSLDFMIISEYVENASQRDKLEELGCDIFQGYLYSKPVPIEKFKEFTLSGKPKS